MRSRRAPMSRNNASYLLKRDFDEVEDADGNVVYVPKRPALRMLGKPPWTLKLSDMWEDTIPPDATDLVGAIEWRGVTFERKE